MAKITRGSPLYFLATNVFSSETPYIFTANRQDARFDKILGSWLEEIETSEREKERKKRQQQQQQQEAGRGRRRSFSTGGGRGTEIAEDEEGENVNQRVNVSCGKKYGTHSIRKGSATYAS